MSDNQLVRGQNVEAAADLTRWLAATASIICLITGVIVPFIPLIYIVPTFIANLASWIANRNNTQGKNRTSINHLRITIYQKWRVINMSMLAIAIFYTGLILGGIVATPVFPSFLAAAVLFEFFHFERKQLDLFHQKKITRETSKYKAAMIKKDIRFTISKMIAGVILAACAFAMMLNPLTIAIAAPIALAATALPILGRVQAGRDFLYGSNLGTVWLQRLSMVAAVTGLILMLAVPGLNIAPVIVGAAVAVSYLSAMLQYRGIDRIDSSDGLNQYSNENDGQLESTYKPKSHKKNNPLGMPSYQNHLQQQPQFVKENKESEAIKQDENNLEKEQVKSDNDGNNLISEQIKSDNDEQDSKEKKAQSPKHSPKK